MDPRDFKSLLKQTVVIPVLLVALLAGLLLWQIAYLSRAYDQSGQTQQLDTKARQFLRLALDMETGARGYLLTGDRSFLDPYWKAEPTIENSLRQLSSMVADRPEYQIEVRELNRTFTEWRFLTRQMIDAGPNSSMAKDPVINLRGKQLMDEMRGHRERLLNAVDAENQERSDHIRQVMRQTMVMLLVLSAVIATLLAMMIRRGTASLIQTYVRHIEAERRSSAAASEAREWLMTTLRSMNEAVFTTDEHWKVTFMNPAAEKLTGLRVNDSMSQPLSKVLTLVDEDTREPVEVIVPGPRLETGHASVAMLRRPDAQHIFVEYSYSPIRNDSQLAGTVVIVRDVSERRRSEAALRSSERLSLLGRLSATIAHEIRNPLDAVMNLVYLIRTSTTLDESSKNFASTAEEELQRIAAITHQLLAFNREAKQPVATDVADLMSGVLKLFTPKLASAGITIKSELDSKTSVIALPGELRQVFSNLVANAIDVLPRGGTLAVRVSDAREHGVRERAGVRITVADDGPGIPGSVLDSLFTPFFTTKGEKGTGLGLWVSRGIVTKHEGSMRLRSKTDGSRRGTVFSIFLPAQPESRALRSPAA